MRPTPVAAIHARADRGGGSAGGCCGRGGRGSARRADDSASDAKARSAGAGIGDR